MFANPINANPYRVNACLSFHISIKSIMLFIEFRQTLQLLILLFAIYPHLRGCLLSSCHLAFSDLALCKSLWIRASAKCLNCKLLKGEINPISRDLVA